MKQVSFVNSWIILWNKLFKIQDANRELGSKLKEKDAQVLRLKEVNKELRRINKNSSSTDKVTIKEDLDEAKTQLENRDKEFKVSIWFQ